MTVIAWDGASEYTKESYTEIRIDGRWFLSTSPISMAHIIAAAGRDSSYRFFQEREGVEPDTERQATDELELRHGDSFYSVPPYFVADRDAGIARAVHLIYRGARAQGDTPERAMQRCAEAFQVFGVADEARAQAIIERSLETVPPELIRAERAGESSPPNIVMRVQPWRNPAIPCSKCGGLHAKRDRCPVPMDDVERLAQLFWRWHDGSGAPLEVRSYLRALAVWANAQGVRVTDHAEPSKLEWKAALAALGDDPALALAEDPSSIVHALRAFLKARFEAQPEVPDFRGTLRDSGDLP